MDTLEQARAEIDAVDAQLAALFERRMAAVLSVAQYKQAHGLPIFDAAREAVVLEKAAARIHEMHFARDVADRILFMDGGVVVEEGPARQLIDHPKEERTKQFLAHYAE